MRRLLLAGWFAMLLLLMLWFALPAATAAENNTEVAPEAAPEYAKPDKRMFGVLPNYRSVDSSIPFYSLTPRQKLSIATHDSFDWPTFLVTGVYASRGGFNGYPRRYTTSLGDQMIGNMMTEGFLPVLMHDDPRFFRSGEGAKGARLKSALRQILITRSDSGSWRFNAPEWVGNSIAVGIGNAYYTDDPRTIGSNLQRLGMQVGMDTLSNVMKEFWPDIKQRFLPHR